MLFRLFSDYTDDDGKCTWVQSAWITVSADSAATIAGCLAATIDYVEYLVKMRKAMELDYPLV